MLDSRGTNMAIPMKKKPSGTITRWFNAVLQYQCFCLGETAAQDVRVRGRI